MAPHSSTPAWKIPWTEEPGRLQSMGSLRVGHDWATSLSLFTFMATHSSVLIWRIPGMGEPGGLPSMGSHRVGHGWSDLAAAAAAAVQLREKAMATHSITLAWKIPWMEEPGRLQSMGSRRVRHDWATSLSLPGGSESKESACNAWDPGSISGSGRSPPGGGHGKLLQYSCLENPMDREEHGGL